MAETKIVLLRGEALPASPDETDREAHALVTALRHIAHRAASAGFEMAATLSEIAADAILEDVGIRPEGS